MKFSEQWLRKWVNPSVDSATLAQQLTMAGLEVDSVTPAAGNFKGVVVGHVVSVEEHPDAKRLRCCKVDVGESEPLDIVCGGTNVREGLRVPVALVGAELPGDFKIKKAKLRGKPSNGMICSLQELEMGEGVEGEILELREDAPIGKDFREYLALNDQVIDIELTPNRGDCCSIRGIARELAVINDISMNAPAITRRPASASVSQKVKVDAIEACPRYVGRVIQGIKSALTPTWMEERLRRSGLRAIHPVVDTLNYVMLEIGQPMHAFDLDKVHGTITVRYGKKSEKLMLLDEQEIQLHSESLLIADEQGPIALAGVMGGKESAVAENTTSIFLESAFFEPVTVRRTARQHGLQTDSSYRFERGVDYQLQVDAIERATELLLSIVGGEVGPVIEVASESHLPKETTINFRSQEVRRLLGLNLHDTEIERILMALGMDVRSATGGWVVGVPSYRFDLDNEADLVEEVARIYGYDRIPTATMPLRTLMPVNHEAHLTPASLADYLVNRGYREAITYSFIDPELHAQFDPNGPLLALKNPIASDLSVMRTSLLPGLVKALQYNQHRQLPRVRLFEVGQIFTQEDGDYEQITKLGIVVGGLAFPEQWGEPKRPIDFYDVKADIEALLARTHCQAAFKWEKGEHPALHPGQTAVLYRDAQPIGYLGMLHPEIKEALDLVTNVCCFEVAMDPILMAKLPVFTQISKFPAIRRDISIMVGRDITGAELIQCIEKKAGQLLSKVELFDSYQGEHIEKDKKSVALGLTFQDPSRTLIDSEINEVIQHVVATLERDFNAKLRA